MISLLSPAKTLDFETSPATSVCTRPEFLNLSNDLIQGLSKLKTEEIASLMNISPKLADLNRERFQNWKLQHDPNNAKQAILAFKGDVYAGLQAWDFQKADFSFAQKHLRVLSGLYGVLKPLDLIQPYRLEMGTVFPNKHGKDLYSFWGDKIAEQINKDLKKNRSQFVLNLASQEYFKAAGNSKIDAQIISPSFLDEKNGKYKIISFYAKKARGSMANFLITNRIENPDDIVQFDHDGYKFAKGESSPDKPVFVRSEKLREAA